MDTAVLKALLQSQESAYRNAMEVFMKEVKDQNRELRSTVQDLKTSLEFSQQEIDNLKQQVNQLKQKNTNDKLLVSELSDNLHASSQAVTSLQERCDYQEDYNRRNSLQFVGIDEDNNETWEQSAKKVSHLLEDKLQLPNIQLERAHRGGQHHPNRQRPIIARFTRFCDREAVMRNVAKLRGSRIYINEDLCPASHEKKKAQLPLLKKARSEGKVAYFRHTKLIVKERNTQLTTSLAPNDDRNEARSPDVMEGATTTVSPGAVGGGRVSVGDRDASCSTSARRSTTAYTLDAAGATGKTSLSSNTTAGRDKSGPVSGAYSSEKPRMGSPVTAGRQTATSRPSTRSNQKR